VADYEIPDENRYTDKDEWARAEGDSVVIGITDFAQQQLGDIVYVELPAEGSQLTQDEPFGVIEFGVEKSREIGQQQCESNRRQ